MVCPEEPKMKEKQEKWAKETYLWQKFSAKWQEKILASVKLSRCFSKKVRFRSDTYIARIVYLIFSDVLPIRSALFAHPQLVPKQKELALMIRSQASNNYQMLYDVLNQILLYDGVIIP